MLNAETYITTEKGIGGRIRTQYEDFYVEEIPENQPSGEGPNTWLFIDKIGRNTLDVVLDIARELKINRKRMGFAGMKDKAAHTRQWLCVSNVTPEELSGLEKKLYGVKILDIRANQKKLRIGQLIGNKFRLLIRETENPAEDSVVAGEILKKLEQRGVPNYYGWQRFGKNRPNTHRVGEALIRNDLKGAVDSYIGNPYPDEANHIKSARSLYDQGEWEEAYHSMPAGMRYEKMMLRTLLKEKKKKGELDDKSYVITLHSLPKPLSRMFVHAYQSYLFNEAVSERAKLGIDQYVEGDIMIDNEEHLIHEFKVGSINEEIKNFQAHPTAPLYGTKVPLAGGKVGEMEQKIMDNENLKPEDFEVPKMPKLGSHGLRRAVRFKIWEVSSEATPDGVLVSFSIPKGCYATAVLREVMKVDVY
ncbi:MAG TPA: tRNA pseudouridine(13) synthase TruD [Methanobacteriaceae archaeon]|nr:tRNA pseudouridine(13) synthase TruD [Methanobacteriaceae archaeon]